MQRTFFFLNHEQAHIFTFTFIYYTTPAGKLSYANKFINYNEKVY